MPLARTLGDTKSLTWPCLEALSLSILAHSSACFCPSSPLFEATEWRAFAGYPIRRLSICSPGIIARTGLTNPIVHDVHGVQEILYSDEDHYMSIMKDYDAFQDVQEMGIRSPEKFSLFGFHNRSPTGFELQWHRLAQRVPRQPGTRSDPRAGWRRWRSTLAGKLE